jgi:hypothetical protein
MQAKKSSFWVKTTTMPLKHVTARAVFAWGLCLGLQVSAQTIGRWESAGSMVSPPPAAPTRVAAAGQGEGWLQMYGVRMSTATREEMRRAIRQQGLVAEREDEAFEEDIYEASHLMPGLLQLKFTYTREGQKLARVDYVFAAFSDNAHAGELTHRVQKRFGRPAQVTGYEEGGPYHALWRLPDQIELFVGRAWPQKNSYMKFFNVAVMGSAATVEREAMQSRPESSQNNHALPEWVGR